MLICSRETSQSFQDYAHCTARATVRDTEKIHLGAVSLERGSSNALERERDSGILFIISLCRYLRTFPFLPHYLFCRISCNVHLCFTVFTFCHLVNSSASFYYQLNCHFSDAILDLSEYIK